MTQKQYDAKMKVLKKEINDLFDRNVRKLKIVMKNEIEEADDNYLLPKEMACAIAEEIRWQYEPITRDGRKNVKYIYPKL